MRELFRSLAWLEPVIELLRLGCFLLFVGLVVASVLAVVRDRDEATRRRRAQWLIVYVFAITTVVGIIQIDSWPFTNWALVHQLRVQEMGAWEIEARDSTGRVWNVDPRVLQPIAPEEFGGWLINLPRLSTTDREVVMQYILGRAEEGRRRHLQGRFPANDWLFGPFSAPYHYTASRVWRSAHDVPEGPFIAARIVATKWLIEERFRRGDAAVRRSSFAATANWDGRR